jgi:hypothetical protein
MTARLSVRFATALCAGILTISIAGCGLNTSSTSAHPSAVKTQGLTGYAHGGEQAITGATVKLYKTQSLTSGNYTTTGGVYTPASGFISQPLAIGYTSDGSGTNANGLSGSTNAGNTLPAGGFDLSAAGIGGVNPGTLCSAPDYMYATVSGGNAGGGTNNNILLMALVGPCTGSATTYQTDIDEVTTVAAAYALSGFTSVATGNAVSVVSSSTNYATATPSAATVATATATVAGGAVTGFTITNPGSGYTSAPTVAFYGGTGSGATAAATISGGTVTNIAVGVGGTGYTVAPTVVLFSGMGGLQHAITNAWSLANFSLTSVTTPNGATPPGQANSTLPTQNTAACVANNSGTGTNGACTGTAAQTAVIPAYVPQAEINTLANVLQYCVNSTGATNATSVGSTSAAFSTPTTVTSTTGSTSTLGALSGSNTLQGTVNIIMNGTTASVSEPFGTTLATLNNDINNNATLSGEGITSSVNGSGVLTLSGPAQATNVALNFGTPSTPSATAGSSATITGFLFANGTVSISVAGSSAITGSISGTTTLATFVSAFNALTQFSTAGLVASANSAGTTLIVTGPAGIANSLSFSGTSLTGSPINQISITGGYSQDTDDGTPCGKLFAVTTPPSGPNAGVVPSNTLQAMLNLAKYPAMNAGAVTGIFSLIPPQSAFGPYLSIAPLDWTMSITYRPLYAGGYPIGTTTPVTVANTYAYYAAIDSYDTLYAVVENTTSSNATTQSLYSIGYNPSNTVGYNNQVGGFLNYATGADACGSTIPASGSENKAPFYCTIANAAYLATSPILAVDSLGNVWMSYSGAQALQIQASSGLVLQGYPSFNGTFKGLAVDKNNNVWEGGASSTAAEAQMEELPYCPTGPCTLTYSNNITTSSAGTTGVAVAGQPYGPITGASGHYSGYSFGYPLTSSNANTISYGIAVDAFQNIWFTGYSQTGSSVYVLPNLTTNGGTPTYQVSGATGTTLGTVGKCTASSRTTVGCNTENVSVFLSYLNTADAQEPYGIALDAGGNVWMTPYYNTSLALALEEVPVTTNTNGTLATVGGSYGTTTTTRTSGTTSNTFTNYPFGGSMRFVEVDGGGNLWSADYSGHGVEEFNIATSTFLSETTASGFQACQVNTTTNACGTNAQTGTGANLGTRSVVIDSTGSVWTPTAYSNPSTTPGATIVQMIGTAAPTAWLGATTPGVMP